MRIIDLRGQHLSRAELLAAMPRAAMGTSEATDLVRPILDDVIRLPCYDFTPVMNHKVVSALPKVKLPTSFATHSHGVTGGVYKARAGEMPPG